MAQQPQTGSHCQNNRGFCYVSLICGLFLCLNHQFQPWSGQEMASLSSHLIWYSLLGFNDSALTELALEQNFQTRRSSRSGWVSIGTMRRTLQRTWFGFLINSWKISPRSYKHPPGPSDWLNLFLSYRVFLQGSLKPQYVTFINNISKYLLKLSPCCDSML